MRRPAPWPLALTSLALASVALAGEPKLEPPEGRRFEAQAAGVSTMEVSSGATWLLTTSFEDKKAVTVHDLATRKTQLAVTGWPANLSPDGKLLAVHDAAGISVYDLASKKKLGTCGRYSSGDICVSHDGKLVAAAYRVADPVNPTNEKGWRVCLWKIATGEETRAIDLDDGPAGALGFAKGDAELVVWQWKRRSPAEFATVLSAVDLATGKARVLPTPRVGAGLIDTRLSPEGERIVWSCDGELTLTSVSTGETLWTKDAAKRLSVHFSADGERIVGVPYDRSSTASVFSAATGAKDATLDVPESGRPAALAEDWLLTGASDGGVVFVRTKDR